jgi:hypothetical protein
MPLNKNLKEVLHPVELDEVIRPGDAGFPRSPIRLFQRLAKNN